MNDTQLVKAQFTTDPYAKTWVYIGGKIVDEMKTFVPSDFDISLLFSQSHGVSGLPVHADDPNSLLSILDLFHAKVIKNEEEGYSDIVFTAIGTQIGSLRIAAENTHEYAELVVNILDFVKAEAIITVNEPLDNQLSVTVKACCRDWRSNYRWKCGRVKHSIKSLRDKGIII